MVYESESITSPLKSLLWVLFHHHHLEFSAGPSRLFVHRLLFPSCTSCSRLSKPPFQNLTGLTWRPLTFTKKLLLIYILGYSFDITCSSWRPSLISRWCQVPLPSVLVVPRKDIYGPINHIDVISLSESSKVPSFFSSYFLVCLIQCLLLKCLLKERRKEGKQGRRINDTIRTKWNTNKIYLVIQEYVQTMRKYVFKATVK